MSSAILLMNLSFPKSIKFLEMVEIKDRISWSITDWISYEANKNTLIKLENKFDLSSSSTYWQL